MPSNIIETAEIDVEAAFDEDVSEVDQTYRQVAKVTYVVSLLLEGLGYPDNPEIPEAAHRLREAFHDEVSTVELADDRENYRVALEEAFECGRSIINHDRTEELKQDFSTADKELLQEVRATVAYVGGHLGIDVDVPSPEGET